MPLTTQQHASTQESVDERYTKETDDIFKLQSLLCTMQLVHTVRQVDSVKTYASRLFQDEPVKLQARKIAL